MLVMFFANIQSQTYYGEKGFGKLQILNNSTCTVNFISMGYYFPIDSCHIRKHGDTVWLSTKARWRYKANIFDEMQTSLNPWYPIIIKRYFYAPYNKKDKYEFQGEDIAMYDSVTNTIIYENALRREEYIIVFKDIFEYHRIKCSSKAEKYYLTIEMNPDYIQGVIFNEFPLLIKRKRLIPIDKEKQMQCWLDNGFFFPKMKISKKEKEYNVINGHSIGLRNLPTEMKQGISKPLPRKYLKYLNNK
jgi:hypothetical protein